MAEDPRGPQWARRFGVSRTAHPRTLRQGQVAGTEQASAPLTFPPPSAPFGYTGKGREQQPPPPLSGEGGGRSEAGGGEFWRDSAHLTGCDRGETRGTFGPRTAGEASVSARSQPLPSYYTYTPCGSCGYFRRQGHAFSGTDTPLLPPRPLFFSAKPIGRTGPRKGVGRRQARRGCSVVRATGMCRCRSAPGWARGKQRRRAFPTKSLLPLDRTGLDRRRTLVRLAPPLLWFSPARSLPGSDRPGIGFSERY